jgi:hypothetical protein
MSKASKARKRERRLKELQKIQGLERQAHISVSAGQSPLGGASTSQLSSSPQTENSYSSGHIYRQADRQTKPGTEFVSDAVEKEFAHVKFDLIKISFVILLVVAFYTVITLIDNRTGFLSDLAKSIFRFLQLPL